MFQDSNNARYINEINRAGISDFNLCSTLIYIIGVVLILGLFVIVFVVFNKKPKPIPIPSPPHVIEDPKKDDPNPKKTIILLNGQFDVLSGIESPKIIKFPVSPGKMINEFTFGRSPGDKNTHIQLKSDAVSRNQAKLSIYNDRYTLINYSDSNPTSVNDKVMQPNESIEIKNGDLVTMGDIVLKFVKK